ncbi:MAG: energy-coupling factor transporter transmembrane protein EcfT [Eubacterium sp.]|nr:energy-coupling factor transporter transmembrane protein EcfT [Eubacterium sp.]MBR6173305.1 energy-coupling factor transporter transmembrane protein EcfT [Eubacterium sp.]
MEHSITSGQYAGKGSFLSRLDPRCKLYILIGYVILTVISGNPVLLGLSSAFFLLAFFRSGLSFLQILRSSGGVLILILITEMITMIWADAASVGITFWKLVLITLMSVIFSKTTAPWDILDGLRTGFPVTEGAAMSLAIAFDFLPELGRQMEELKTATISRGAMQEEGNVLERIRDYIPLLIPLFRRTLKHAGTLADAMDIRGYDAGAKRTRMEPLKYRRIDHLTFFLFAIYAVMMIVWMILG